MFVVCPDCDVEETGNERPGQCEDCAGWGEYNGVECTTCGGTGDCQTCDGTGEVYEPSKEDL